MNVCQPWNPCGTCNTCNTCVAPQPCAPCAPCNNICDRQCLIIPGPRGLPGLDAPRCCEYTFVYYLADPQALLLVDPVTGEPVPVIIGPEPDAAGNQGCILQTTCNPAPVVPPLEVERDPATGNIILGFGAEGNLGAFCPEPEQVYVIAQAQPFGFDCAEPAIVDGAVQDAVIDGIPIVADDPATPEDEATPQNITFFVTVQCNCDAVEPEPPVEPPVDPVPPGPVSAIANRSVKKSTNHKAAKRALASGGCQGCKTAKSIVSSKHAKKAAAKKAALAKK